jgi:hypothetical protein
VQSATHVLGHISGATLLDPVRDLHDGRLKGQLVFVELGEQGRE